MEAAPLEGDHEEADPEAGGGEKVAEHAQRRAAEGKGRGALLGLDPQAARNLREQVAQLKQEGHTILLTTHYMEEADQLSDRIGIIDAGKVIALDTPEGLKRCIGQEEVIRLELAGWQDDLAPAIRGIPGIESLAAHRQDEADIWDVSLRARDSRAALPRIVESISGNGTRLINMNIVKPSLEDVFIHLTGKGLRD